MSTEQRESDCQRLFGCSYEELAARKARENLSSEDIMAIARARQGIPNTNPNKGSSQ